MKGIFRSISEGLARRTSRRGFFGRGAEITTGALLGVAAGSLGRPGSALGGGGTICNWPGGPCEPCEFCLDTGLCAKPCIINTTWYASGCWVTSGVTCCDCTCPPGSIRTLCGCTTDWHQNPANCS